AEGGVRRHLEPGAVQRLAAGRLVGRTGKLDRQGDGTREGVRQRGLLRGGEAELAGETVHLPAVQGPAGGGGEADVRLGKAAHFHRLRIQIELDELPRPVRDRFLDVVVVRLVRLTPVLVPRAATGDDVVDRPLARLAAGVDVVV